LRPTIELFNSCAPIFPNLCTAPLYDFGGVDHDSVGSSPRVVVKGPPSSVLRRHFPNIRLSLFFVTLGILLSPLPSLSAQRCLTSPSEPPLSFHELLVSALFKGPHFGALAKCELLRPVPSPQCPSSVFPAVPICDFVSLQQCRFFSTPIKGGGFSPFSLRQTSASSSLRALRISAAHFVFEVGLLLVQTLYLFFSLNAF